MSSWRYFAQRFDGSGNLGTFIDKDLPLQGVQITEVLSGHNSLSATITPELSRLKGSDGRPVFDEWGVCLWAESPNGDVYGGILETSNFDGPTWSLDCIDLSGAIIGAPYDTGSGTDGTFFVNVDPLDIFRYIWLWFQSQPGKNLGIQADMTHSPVLLGGDLVQVVEFDEAADDPVLDPNGIAPSPYIDNEAWVDKAKKKLSKKPYSWSKDSIGDALHAWLSGAGREINEGFTMHEAKIVRTAIKVLGMPPEPPGFVSSIPSVDPNFDGPVTYQYNAYKLNWYTNHDLSSDIDDLASTTPFDWHLVHYWGDDTDDADLFHRFRLGYPKLGRTIDDLRFVVGENIHQIPTVDRDGEDWASDVIVLGNGEGSAMVHGYASRPQEGRMRRTVTITDQSLTTTAACNARAAQELASRAAIEEITEVILIDHPNAPLGSVQLGDEFLIEGDLGWVDLSVQVRCVGRTIAPDEGDQMTLSIIRTDQLA